MMVSNKKTWQRISDVAFFGKQPKTLGFESFFSDFRFNHAIKENLDGHFCLCFLFWRFTPLFLIRNKRTLLFQLKQTNKRETPAMIPINLEDGPPFNCEFT